MADFNIVDDLSWRGLVHQTTSPDLRDVLAKPPVTSYAGFDPSAESLHVGHLLQILALVRMQRAGHRPIALVGGATGMIGDPSGKSEERTLLSQDKVEANLTAIESQLKQFIDFGPGPNQALVVNNYDWFSSVSLLEFLRTTGKRFSVNAMLDKESVKTRLNEREQGISFTEFSYMLLQAHDFLQLFEKHGCTLQVGGSDQWGNITAGVDLIRRVHNARAFGLTSPLLLSADGKKLGKTEKGAVWLDARRTSPYQFFQYWIRMEDRDVIPMLRMLTMRTQQEIEDVDRAHASRPEAQEAQRLLARDMTSLVHGQAAARDAECAAAALFGQQIAELDERTLLDVMAEAPSTELARDSFCEGRKPLVDLLADTGLSSSKSAARNDIKGGGIYVNNRRVSDIAGDVSIDDALMGRYLVLRRGKKTFHLVKLVG